MHSATWDTAWWPYGTLTGNVGIVPNGWDMSHFEESADMLGAQFSVTPVCPHIWDTHISPQWDMSHPYGTWSHSCPDTKSTLMSPNIFLPGGTCPTEWDLSCPYGTMSQWHNMAEASGTCPTKMRPVPPDGTGTPSVGHGKSSSHWTCRRVLDMSH